MSGIELIEWLTAKPGGEYARRENEFFLGLFSIIGFGQYLGLAGAFPPIIEQILSHPVSGACGCSDIRGCPANPENRVLVDAIVRQREALTPKEGQGQD